MNLDFLIEAIKRDFPTEQISTDQAWDRTPAISVLDCVLSLNRRYDGFVVPRINKFQEKYPNIKTIRQLIENIHKYNSENEFVEIELNYRDPIRAIILIRVVEFLLSISDSEDVDIEKILLINWANKETPLDYKKLNIKGFGVAGFQYLRMLFGANTTKPDIYIKRYVSKYLEEDVSEIKAIEILEKIAKEINYSVRNLDTMIWEKSAR